MGDVTKWLATATRSLAVDLAGAERRRAARSRLRLLAADLLVLSVLLLAVAGIVVVVGVAVGAATGAGRVPEVVGAWTLMFAALGALPLLAMRTATVVYTRIHA